MSTTRRDSSDRHHQSQPAEDVASQPEANSEEITHFNESLSGEETESQFSRPGSRSNRLPHSTSRASFSRTSSHTKELDDDGLSLAGETRVLITELQNSDSDYKYTETVDEASNAKNETEKKLEVYEDTHNGGEAYEDTHTGQEDTVPELEVSTSYAQPCKQEAVHVRLCADDYDTDLEIEEEDEEDKTLSYYRTVCEQLGSVPIMYFLRHIQDHNIRMRYRGLGPDATRAISLALKESITLERLDLTGNWIGAEGARYMGRLLEENDYITDVCLSENKMGSDGGQHMAKMLEINGGLRRLEIAGNQLDDKCAQALFAALGNNKYLRELNLSHNNFAEVGAEFLGPAISANENMDVLNLSWNQLREKGGVSVARGLKENVRLKVINLSWNGLGVTGGLAVADAMMTNQSLLELDISGNRLTLEVALKMAKVLTTNDTIKVLRMGNNPISSAGVIALATAINNIDQCEIRELDLTDIPVEYEFLRTLEDIKAQRPNFKVSYGPVMRAGNTRDDIKKPAIDVDRVKKEPVVFLKEHIIVNDIRLLDVLQKYDGDNTRSISAKDFIRALEELAVPYDKKRLEEAVHKFAATSKNKIYFGSFVSDAGNERASP